MRYGISARISKERCERGARGVGTLKMLEKKGAGKAGGLGTGGGTHEVIAQLTYINSRKSFRLRGLRVHLITSGEVRKKGRDRKTYRFGPRLRENASRKGGGRQIMVGCLDLRDAMRKGGEEGRG